MASAFTHAVAAVALGHVLVPRQHGLWLLGALCAAAPDLDVIGFRLGVPYGDVLGHRGLTHSLPFAALSAALLARLWRWRAPVAVVTAGTARAEAQPSSSWRSSSGAQPASSSGLRVWAFLFAAIASHGPLDALTNGGLGVAFLAPFSSERFFFPWQPIEVSPISVRRFFSARGWRVLQSELLVVWLPALALMLLGSGVRRARQRQES